MEFIDTTAPPSPPPPPPPCYNNNDLSAAVAKGKRTKRYRPHSPPNIPFIITPPAGEYHTTATTFSAASSASEESTTTEEEDTARCLILLARGHNFSIHVSNDNQDLKHDATSKIRQAASGGGACMYACKTCDRVFSSFQALGGHRASHKKPKNDKRPPFFSDHEEDSPPQKKLKMLEFGNISTVVASAAAAASPRTHECSYCGAEFPSGQALGGHMRRHRTDPDAKKPPRNNGLSLDLNLPAPEDENQRLGLAGGQHESSEKLVLLTALIN